MIIVRLDLPKLCHAKPGTVIRTVDNDGCVGDELYMVIVHPEAGKRAERANMSHGLYDDERHLAMVNLETGVVKKLPHLSSRVKIERGVRVHLGSDCCE